MTHEDLEKEILEVLNNYGLPERLNKRTARLLVKVVNKHVAEVIGEDTPHADNIEFIDPVTGISSKDRVKIWNECKKDIRERAGLT